MPKIDYSFCCLLSYSSIWIIWSNNYWSQDFFRNL